MVRALVDDFELSADYKRLAEREGFEPPIPVKVCPLSRRIVSTTHAPLRVGRIFLFSSRILARRSFHLRLRFAWHSASGFRLRAQTPANRLNFNHSHTSPESSSSLWLLAAAMLSRCCPARLIDQLSAGS